MRDAVTIGEGGRPLVRGGSVYGLIAAVGAVLWLVSVRWPAEMPAVGPYAFQPPIYAAVALALLWYLRGLSRLGREAPPLWRRAAFVAGLALLWIATQTGFEYLAQRMFFLNRVQHVGLHHVGPVLLGLSMAGPVILAGGPAWLRALAATVAARRVMAVVQRPGVATVLFVGTFWFWLIPSVHFTAMLDPWLYQLMNWTMAVDGILFWAMVLDTRPRGRAGSGGSSGARSGARVSFGLRAVLSVAVMFPQILLGALITFARGDLFPYYAYCGRYFPGIDAVTDQQIGGIVIWIPPAMMSVVGLLVVLGNMRRAEGQVQGAGQD
ncbi:cytochrome c oxidase assembly protein [Acidimangrovimonas sediminis]|uniref:cytochrome c oxidase assembly protein n=1 Tax=Acidimangrovimonas sediminis TaxID=2056283 RepID=UPI0013049428|nr:cytochrome c oxidase assembly protein [Acidimangrovimonas sediminis]